MNAVHADRAGSASAQARPHAAAASHRPPWLGMFQDLRREHGFEPLAVSGKLPSDLVGTLYRNGPGRFEVGGERVGHWFDGDGAVSAVRFDGARAFGAVRLVATRGLARETAAGKRLFGGYDTPVKRPFRELILGDSKNPANTAILLWQGRVFADCEAGKPYEVSTRDLSTIGETDLGAITGAFSAHAHYVRSRKTTYNFGVTHGARGTTFTAYALPDDGPARAIGSFQLPGVRLNHDFVVSGRCLVFVIAPVRLSLLRVLAGKGPVSSARWTPKKGVEIVVMPIADPTRIRRARTDAFMLEHVVNAFDDGDDVVFDYTHYASPYGLEGFARGLVRGVVESPLASVIKRARVNVDTGALRSETILDEPVELPRVSPLVEAQRHRFAYHVGARGGVFERLVKHDTETGAVEIYGPAPHKLPGEPVIVPRENARAEDDAWVLTMVYDTVSGKSALEVLDARSIGDGPVASAQFDHAIPAGFHGAWAPAI